MKLGGWYLNFIVLVLVSPSAGCGSRFDAGVLVRRDELPLCTLFLLE